MTAVTDGFVETLRAHSRRYHDRHPFHVRMNAGRLSRGQVRGWVANRFYYQENIPRKDAAILANCPDRDVRRRWIRRILDHDGTEGEEGGIDAWLRLAEAVGLTREEVRDALRRYLQIEKISLVQAGDFTRVAATPGAAKPN